MMANPHVDQIVTVKINLDPSEINDKYEATLKEKIKNKYGDVCHMNGFIKKSSIELIEITNGHRSGFHLQGFMTFNIKFRAVFYIPQRDSIIKCRIKKLTKFGAIGTSYPMEISIPRQLQQYHNIGIFETLNEGDFANVIVNDYNILDGKLFVVGIIKELVNNKQNAIYLPCDGVLSNDYQVTITKSTLIPIKNKWLGDNQQLAQYQNNINNDLITWNTLIEPLINSHSSIDQIKNVLSPSYFQLWEILSKFNLLDSAKEIPINIANLFDGSGGWIECLIDYRNKQHMTEWKNDNYYGQTVEVTDSDLGDDWNNIYSKNYFNLMKMKGYKIELITGDLLDTDFLENFRTKTQGKNKYELITANGSLKPHEHNHSFTELSNAKLFFSEILAAMTIQKLNGTLILKIYDVYYDLTVQMIHLLSFYYGQIDIIKPRASSPTTSEKYLICQYFNGINQERLDQLYGLFKHWSTIERNVDYLKNKNYVSNILTVIENTKSSFFEEIIGFNRYNFEIQFEKIAEGLTVMAEITNGNTVPYSSYRKDKNKDSLQWSEDFGLFEEKNVINRKLTDNYPEFPWSLAKRNVLDLKRSHWGQLKLFYTELEFLTTVSETIDLSECILVYVGSAPGHHTVFLRKLFPSLHMILYDPMKFVEELEKDLGVEIHTGDDGFFTDKTIGDVLNNPRVKDKKILFISDIRKSEEDQSKFERNVFENMIQQQKWAIHLNSYMAMLKCRFPYTGMDGGVTDCSYDIDDIKNQVEIANNKDTKKTQMLYLDGDIYFQVSPPVSSTETRLIIKRNNGKYKLKYYDVGKYESQLCYYNTFDRVKKYEYKDSDKLKYHLIGFDDSCDRVSEFFIYCKYREVYLKKQYDFSETVKLLFDTHAKLYDITKGRNIVGIAMDKIHSSLQSKKTRRVDILKNKANIPFIIKNIQKNTTELIDKILYQIDSLQDTILSKDQKQYQITVALKEIEKITYIKKESIDSLTKRITTKNIRSINDYGFDYWKFIKEKGLIREKYGYPYLKEFYETKQIKDFFATLISFKPTITNTPYKLKFIGFNESQSKYGDRHILIIDNPYEYPIIEIIADYFNEKCRAKCVFKGTNMSSYDYFMGTFEDMSSNNDPRGSFEKIARYLEGKRKKITYENLHEAIFTIGPKQCSNFKPKLMKYFIDLYKAKKVLDISSGWGDRLIGAMAADVEEYVGYDPNQCLHENYDEMIKFFKPKGKYNLYKEGFENAKLQNNYFDLVMSSPPYFDIEVYAGKDTPEGKTQSIHEQTERTWYKNYLLKWVDICHKALKPKGHLALNIYQIKGYSYTNWLLKDLADSEEWEYLGVISHSKPDLSNPQPTFIWQKRAKN